MSDSKDGGVEIVQRFNGTLYDLRTADTGPTEEVIQSKDDLAAFTKYIVTRHPRYHQKRKGVQGWTESTDPLLTGEAKIDFEAHTLVVVQGMVKITGVTTGDDGSTTVAYDWDMDQHHDRAYVGVLVPKLSGTVLFHGPTDTSDRPASMSRPTVHAELESAEISQRAVDVMPMVMQRPMVEQRVMDAMPADLEALDLDDD